MPGFHSPRSPSSAHRWRLCAQSIFEEEGLPDDAGEEAIQGTLFHDYAADCVELGLEPQGLVGDRFLCEDGEYREFTQEMADKMLPGLDVIWSEADAPDSLLFVETKLDLSPWLGPNEFGTCDAAVINVTRWRIVVFDWKWGAGVPVSPEHNDQAMLYGLGAWNTIARELFEKAILESGGNLNDPWEDDIEVVIIIEQPRAPGGGGVWRTTMGELLREGKKIKRDADATRDPKSKHNPGPKQCQFCRAAAHNTCKARTDYLGDLMGVDEEELEVGFAVSAEIDLTDAKALSPEARSQLVLHRKMIEKWLQSLHDETMEDSKKGRPTPGLKRIAGRSSPRAWKDEDKAAILLENNFGEAAWTKKLRSPAMIQDEVKKKVYEERYERHVLQGDSKPVLVAEQDPRPALADHNSAYDDLESEDQMDALI